MSASSTAPQEPRPPSALSAFAFRDFRYWIGYRLLSGIALQIKNVGVGWYLYDLTGSAVALALAGLFTFLPSLVLALITGHAADTYNRKRIVVLSYSLAGVSMLALTLAVYVNHSPLWLIYLAVVMIGVGRAFANPASQAITPNLVPRAHFANAVTWYSSSWHLASVTGPAIGGLLYWWFGTLTVFAIATLIFFVAALCAYVLRTPLDPSTAGRGPVTWETLSAGFVFLWSKPVMLGAISLDLVAVLFGGVTALLPIVAKDILQTGPEGLGLLRSCPAIGAIAMSAFLARYPIRKNAGKLMLICVAIYGVAVVAFGFSSWLWVSMGLLLVVGASDMVSVVIRHTMVQAETPDEMRGRVAAVNSIFIGTASDLGEFRAGMSAAAIGTAPAIIIGGMMTVGFALAWFKVFPALAKRQKVVED